jgi:hypothetical protein
MSDARWGDPRHYGERERGDERPRVYDERDRDNQDPRDGLMHDLDVPRGEEARAGCRPRPSLRTGRRGTRRSKGVVTPPFRLTFVFQSACSLRP